MTSTELARLCGITASTCSLLLHDLEQRMWVHRRDDRRYTLGAGLLPIVRGVRTQFPLLDRGREALTTLYDQLGAACSLARVGSRHLTVVDVIGHVGDGDHDLGQRFPIDPPFGLVAMAWKSTADIDDWLQRVEPRLSRSDIDRQIQVLADIRARGFGAWRFNEDSPGLHDRLASILESMQPTAHLTTRLTTLMTMVSLQSVTATLENDLNTTEFIVLPIFGKDDMPAYQIQIHLAQSPDLTMSSLTSALSAVQRRLTDV